MATTTCGKCGNTSFEMAELRVSKAKFKLQSVQCSSCGVPIGVLEYMNIGANLEQLEAKLTNLLSSIESKVNRIR